MSVSPSAAELTALGATVQLSAEVRDQNGSVMDEAAVAWSSTAGSVATVDTAGLVTAVAAGTVMITAMAGTASDAIEVRVIDIEWAADFVARQHVVDVMNVGVRVDPNCTAECERALFPGDGRRDLGGIKEVTGIDMSMTNPGQGDYPEQFSDGRVGNVRVVRTYADIDVARRDGDFAIMWYLQTRPATGRWQLGGNVATLADWYDEGLRVLQIAYGSHREDAAAPEERLGYGAGEGEEEGITDLGRRAVAEMNRLGMVVDCSHCNRRTTLDAASVSTMPILANHANAKTLTDDPYERNKTDEELMAIAATGGVIGVTPIRLLLDTDGDGVTGMDDMIAHIEYIASLVGIDHVGIATDTYVDGWEPSSHHYASADLAALDRWVRLTARLQARGWSEEDLSKLLGGNFLRVFQEVLRPAAVEAISVELDTEEFTVGQSATLTAMAIWTDGRREPLTEGQWESSNPEIATIESGERIVLRALTAGSVTVSVSAAGQRGTLGVDVLPLLEFWGSIEADPDIITPEDPSVFADVSYDGRETRRMLDKRSGWVEVEAFVFNATYEDGFEVEIAVNPEFETSDAALVEARKYGWLIGQMPQVLRGPELKWVWIHQGDAAWGGGFNRIIIHTGRTARYQGNGWLEEVIMHEAVHTALDPYHRVSDGWLAAQAADSDFISGYARENPNREDVAESFPMWVALRFREDRISARLATTIRSRIAHRLAYFDAQNFAMAPVH